MAKSVISLSNVNLTLPSRAGPVAILKQVALEIGPAEAVAIIGPSGSGKTSLLMVIAGLERASSGAVLVAGHDFSRLDDGSFYMVWEHIDGEDVGGWLRSKAPFPVPLAVEHHDHEVLDVPAEALRDGLQIRLHRRVEPLHRHRAKRPHLDVALG